MSKIIILYMKFVNIFLWCKVYLQMYCIEFSCWIAYRLSCCCFFKQINILETPKRVMLKLGGKYANLDVDDFFVSSHKKRKIFLSKLKLLLYIIIGYEFWKSNRWIACSYYIIYICKILRRSNINIYVINQMFKFQVFFF